MLRHFLSSFSFILIGVGCAFFTHLILAKILPASEYGVFSFIYSISLLLSVFSLFGFQHSMVRFIANLENEKFTLRKVINFSRKFTLSLAVLSGICGYFILHLLGLHEKYSDHALQFMCALVPLMVWVRLQSSIFRGFKRPTASVLYETTLREILLLFFVGITFFVGDKIETGVDALMLLVLSLSVVSVISWAHTLKILPSRVEKIYDYTPQTGEWIKVSLPMMFTIFAQRLLRRSDIIVLGFIVHPALVGAYAIAAQFSEVGSIGQKGIFSVFSARAANLYKEGAIEKLKSLYKKMQIYGIISTAGMSVAIAVLAPFIFGYFGDDYSAGYQALLILLIGQFVNVCFGPVGVLMIMTQYEKETMKLTFGAALGNLLLNPPAIYLYGIEGAAIVTAFFLVLRAALSYLFVKRQKLI